MEQRNMLSASQTTDTEIDRQGQGFQYPEPCVVSTFPQSHIHRMTTVSSNSPNIDGHNLDGSMPYVMPQHHSVHHHPNHRAIAPASNFYFPYMAPCSGIPLSLGVCDQLLPSSNYGVMGVSPDEYGSYKRKNAEIPPPNFHYFSPLASSSSSVPQNARPDGLAVTDPTHYSPPQYGVSYMSHPFPPVSSPWFNQQLTNGSLAVPYMISNVPGSNANGGSIGAGSVVSQCYPDPASNQNHATFLPPPPFNPRPHGFPHPLLPIQGMREPNIAVLPQVPPGAHLRYPTSYASQSLMNPPHDGFDAGFRHLRSVQPTGLRIYRPQREGVVSQATLRHHNLPQLRVLPTDGVALLEFPDYYEAENHTDDHRDLRLDIEDMSYEELLALGEWIGNVNTGASDETIRTQLKMRYFSSTPMIDLEVASCMDQKQESCIICQDDYRSEEQIATLDCGHEYHADCLKKWLHIKNVCPICKSQALPTGEQKD